MKTKIIPFDLEMAKKIQAGEIEGRIVTALDNVEMEILTFNSFDKEYPIIARYKDIENMGVELYEYHMDGRTNPDGIHFWFDLNIELPEEIPICNNPNSPRCKVCSNYHCNDCQYNKHEFKPFDKVLVRDTDKDIWRPRLYSRKGRVGYCMQDNYEYMQILPYEGNEHLVGTIDKPKED